MGAPRACPELAEGVSILRPGDSPTDPTVALEASNRPVSYLFATSCG